MKLVPIDPSPIVEAAVEADGVHGLLVVQLKMMDRMLHLETNGLCLIYRYMDLLDESCGPVSAKTMIDDDQPPPDR